MDTRCWERVKMGAATGGVLGLCFGTMYGLYGLVGLRGVSMGARFQWMARTMALTSLSFGFFLAIGSGIRCEPLAAANGSQQKKVE